MHYNFSLLLLFLILFQNPNISSTKGPDFCPRLLPLVQDIHIPVGLERGFQLQATNLPLVVSNKFILSELLTSVAN